MRILLLILLVIIVNCGAYAENIIIKLKTDSHQYISWMQDDRTRFSDKDLDFLGEYQSEAYISNSLMKMMRSNSKHQINEQLSKANSGLDRIIRIKISDALDAKLLAAKINKFEWVEYAEVEPTNELFYTPNDRDISYQYYLDKIHAFEAWDIIDTTKSVVIGIVDTGVDYLHEDLEDNIYNNPGECGFDDSGEDKRYNAIDDDNDGYIDNWRGWDFISDSASGEDNDPYPGNTHGTHVAGIAGAKADNYWGIAGVGYNPKLLPVKVGADDPNSHSVSNGYQGILYAALAGAKIINCSWGSSAKSQAEEEIIKTVVGMDVLIVAAAGNDGRNMDFYPAAYSGVLSVGSTDSMDMPSYFTNFTSSVDVTAPGSDIYSCVVTDYYSKMDGTSMASPVVAGVAALVKNKFPDYTASQIAERIKATSNKLTFGNPVYEGKLGWGRVNAYNAVSADKVYSITVNEILIDGSKPVGVYDRNNGYQMSISLVNYLDNETNISVTVRPKSTYSIEFLDDSVFIGNLDYTEQKRTRALRFNVLAACPSDYTEEVIIHIVGDHYDREEICKITLCPSYRTVSNENLSYTINSRGNLGFNDYPSNSQGIGLKYNGNPSILFEGSTIAGVSGSKVSDAARGLYTSYQNSDFVPDTFAVVGTNSISNYGRTAFHSSINDNEATVKVNMEAIIPNGDNGTILIYRVENASGAYADSLCFGLYYDWDIINSHRNSVYWDNVNKFGVVEYSDSLNSVKAAVKRLYPETGNFFAIDNDGDTDENPGIYDGFTDREKWDMISGNRKRDVSSITDVSMLVSGGPIALDNGDAEYFVFAMTFGNDKPELVQKMQNLENFANENNLFHPLNPYFPNSSRILNVFPNPVNNDFTYCSYAVHEQNSFVEISLYDVMGKQTGLLFSTDSEAKGKHQQKLDLKAYAAGLYFIKIETVSQTDYCPIVIQR